MSVEQKVVYFEKQGRESTGEVLRLARERAGQGGISAIVVASNTGATAAKAAELLDGFKLVVVSRCAGFKEPNVQDFTPENRKLMEARGIPIVVAAHAFGGVNRAVRFKFQTMELSEIMAHTLRTFGQGTKVAVEIALMAADAGLVRTDEDVISVAGSAGGADTALVLRPANSQNFFDLKVKEVLCKPRSFGA